VKRTASSFAIAALLPLAAGCSSGTSQPEALGGGGGTPVVAASANASATKRPGSSAAPSVSLVSFRPPQADGYPSVTDSITASATTEDPDGDGVSVDWKWFINGVELSSELSDTLRPGRWKKHDKIEAEATPRDTRGTIGQPARASIMIRNSTPSITSRPTGSLNGYKAVVTDADSNDSTERFKWSLEAPVAGFALESDGTLRFDAVAGKASSGQKVTIVVTDSAGAFSKQTFDVNF